MVPFGEIPVYPSVLEMKRSDGRAVDAVRDVEIIAGWHRRADGSALYRAGGTVVLCTVSVDAQVKEFLRGQNRGWITAEYLMHPRAGERRQGRDGYNARPLSGRSHEIARLIGRALRAAIHLPALGERTISVDCDVLEADGGTRTASITGAMVALSIALAGMQKSGQLVGKPLRSLVSAVSAGIVQGTPLLDLAYDEDSKAGMDLNVVATEQGEIIEIQCTAEEAPVPRSQVEALTTMALTGAATLVALQRRTLTAYGVNVDSLRA